MSGCGAVRNGVMMGVYVGSEPPFKLDPPIVFDENALGGSIDKRFAKPFFEKLNALSTQFSNSFAKNETYSSIIPSIKLLQLLDDKINRITVSNNISTGSSYVSNFKLMIGNSNNNSTNNYTDVSNNNNTDNNINNNDNVIT
jgi:hypothetical protein